MKRMTGNLGTAAIVAAVVSILFSGAGPASATAAPSDIDVLSLTPINQSGGYFQLDLLPGQTQTVSVSRGNSGLQPIVARTFLANSYTIVNGGFGADLSSASASGTTSWISYADETLQLAPRSHNTANIVIAVPAAAGPGDYLTSIILENSLAAGDSGAVRLNRVVRHALAISIHVPGRYEPGFGFGSISHQIARGHSVIDIALANTGNENLNPAGSLIIRDNTHATVAQSPITLGSVYAHTATQVESTLATGLRPGGYTLTIILTDEKTGLSESVRDRPFTVKSPVSRSAFDQAVAQLPQVFQNTVASPYLVWLSALAALIIIAAILRIRRRRRLSASKL